MDEIRSDQQVAEIRQEIEPIQKKVSDLVIKDERSSKYATDILAFITKAKRKLEDRRKFFVGPLNDHVKTINNEFRSLTEPLEVLEKEIKGKIQGYLAWLREEQKKEDEARQVKADKVAKDLGLPTVQVETEEKRSVRSGLGAVHTVKIWSFVIENLSKIPDEYKVLDEVRVRNAIRAATRTIAGVSSCDLNIPGIKIIQVESIAVRT